MLIVLGVVFLVGFCFLGVVAAIAIPAFSRYQTRSKTSEAMSNLAAIYSAEVSYFNRSAELSPTVQAQFLSCAAMPNPVPSGRRVAGTWTGPDWSALGFTPFGPVYYQYSVVATGVGNSATATLRAIGDLDGDGTTSMFERTLSVVSGEPSGGPTNVVNELE